jgi:hypothetical protein
MGIAAAIWIGVQLGSGLSEDPASLTDEELASAYYQAFSQDETETNTEESSSAGEEQWQ